MNEPICAVEACGRKAKTKGWCVAHYNRWWRLGDLKEDLPVAERGPDARTCSVPACDRPRNINPDGWCTVHLRRWQRTGDVGADRPIMVKRPGAVCSVEGCGKKCVGLGLCGAHYSRLRRSGDAQPERPMRVVLPYDTPCSVPGCAEVIASHKFQLCTSHYGLYMRHGDPLINKRPDLGRSRTDRFWSKVNKNGPLGCWLWTASLDNHGYGQFIVMRGRRGYPRPAHRVAWELLRGEIPEGLVIDHLCRTHACVNPDHLEVVTHGVNVLRGIGPAAINKRRTHCIRGHAFTPENTYRPPKRSNTRQCRKCMKIRELRRRSA